MSVGQGGRLYIVVDIGCLECGNPSTLVGIYTTRAEAMATGAEPAEVLSPDDDWSSHGGGPLRVMFEGEVAR